MASKLTSSYVTEFTPQPPSDGHRTPTGGALPPLPRHRRRRMLVVGLLLIVVGALAAAYLYTGIGDRVSVVVLTRDVPIGTQIDASDVATTRIAADQDVALIPGRQLRQVVGRLAAV